MALSENTKKLAACVRELLDEGWTVEMVREALVAEVYLAIKVATEEKPARKRSSVGARKS